jgi:leucyl-tRNA synthetase
VYFRKPAEGRVAYFNPADVDAALDDKGQATSWTLRSDGAPVESGGIITMSKSKNNGVDPTDLIVEYGADTARLFMMFAAPPEQSMEWSDDGVQGANRFMKRLWRAVYEHVGRGGTTRSALSKDTALSAAARDMRRLAHQTLAKVTDDYARRRVFNTAVAAVMELMNALAKFSDESESGRAVVQEALEFAVIMLSPIVPHAAHALWHELGHKPAVIDVSWPKPDPLALTQDSLELVVQVNGKLRGRVTVANEATEEQIKAAALADPNVTKWLDGKPPKKVIVVRGKLVNVVI